MNRTDIIALVQSRMDEVNPLQQGDTLVDPLITLELDRCAVELLHMLPSVLCRPVIPTKYEMVDDVDTIVKYTPAVENFIPFNKADIVCPDDFLKIHRVRLDYWQKPIYNLLYDQHPKVVMEDYRYIKSTPLKPTGVLYAYSEVVEDELKETYHIECYPVGGEAPQVEDFMYVRTPNTAEELHFDLMDMLAWHTAGRIYAIHGETNNTTLCSGKLKELIQVKLQQ